MIGVVDLQMGNLRSVTNAVSQCGFDARVVRSAEDLSGTTHVILPGVGSYDVAMGHMREQGLFESIRELAARGRPLLGICLGMQLLSASGDEGAGAEGLGLVPGRVVRFDAKAVPAIPHVGWNEARLLRKHPVFAKVKSGVDFYYVHSFHFECERAEDTVAVVEYGGADYTSVIGRGNVLGLQFHPEKSQSSGLRLIENFCEWDGQC